MAFEFNGKTIETTSTGYLVDQDDWSKELAQHMASLESIELTQRHWDLIDYLRDEYFNNDQSTPNTRAILSGGAKGWSRRRFMTSSRSIRPNKAGGSRARPRASAKAATETLGAKAGQRR